MAGGAGGGPWERRRLAGRIAMNCKSRRGRRCSQGDTSPESRAHSRRRSVRQLAKWGDPAAAGRAPGFQLPAFVFDLPASVPGCPASVLGWPTSVLGCPASVVNPPPFPQHPSTSDSQLPISRAGALARRPSCPFLPSSSPLLAPSSLIGLWRCQIRRHRPGGSDLRGDPNAQHPLPRPSRPSLRPKLAPMPSRPLSRPSARTVGRGKLLYRRRWASSGDSGPRWAVVELGEPH